MRYSGHLQCIGQGGRNLRHVDIGPLGPFNEFGKRSTLYNWWRGEEFFSKYSLPNQSQDYETKTRAHG